MACHWRGGRPVLESMILFRILKNNPVFRIYVIAYLMSHMGSWHPTNVGKHIAMHQVTPHKLSMNWNNANYFPTLFQHFHDRLHVVPKAECWLETICEWIETFQVTPHMFSITGDSKCPDPWLEMLWTSVCALNLASDATASVHWTLPLVQLAVRRSWNCLCLICTNRCVYCENCRGSDLAVCDMVTLGTLPNM